MPRPRRSRFTRRVSAGDGPQPDRRPVTLKDNTECLEEQAPHRILLEARGLTTVRMDEVVLSPPPMKLLNPLLDPLIHVRNIEAMRCFAAAVTTVAS